MTRELTLVLHDDAVRTRTDMPKPEAADDPLLRLQQEMQPHDGAYRIECTTHPGELVITGIIQMCPACGARRDWLIICDRNQVSIRCRCAHQWVERELGRADFEAMADSGGEEYDSLQATIQASGYGGELSGTYWT
ncbi:hypothetical protein [Streptomyces ipomoeae]|uniref:Uncharacterized protein n=1 Tax=Streptomyces ipomoeae 91-03 TaxID=698759 RepID=L1KMH6_9ACTN|nr:hypothetical protein [Streptomyces ipomoeae]EKX62016.1 hypothetical protein STRIP9103_05523 [Streptomyces ipomoeae 91-03]MDX2695428.1 hypothetical protein [Streptomyces ipomoeae]MDX2837897.1 hypothetical protein [Streptomyces ipomoeae]